MVKRLLIYIIQNGRTVCLSKHCNIPYQTALSFRKAARRMPDYAGSLIERQV